jgi:hypothetical protein
MTTGGWVGRATIDCLIQRALPAQIENTTDMENKISDYITEDPGEEPPIGFDLPFDLSWWPKVRILTLRSK